MSTVDIFDLSTETEDTANRGEQLSAQIANHIKDVKTFRAQIGKDRLDGVTDPAILRKKQAEVEQLVEDFATKRGREKLPHLDDSLKLIRERAEMAQKVGEVARNPRAMLEALGSKDDGFRDALAEFKDCGAATLTTRLRLAQLASPTVKTRAEIAAICRVVDQMPKDSRPFDTSEVSKQVVGKYHDSLKKNIARIEYENERLQLLSSGRPITTVEKVALGLRAREAGITAHIPSFDIAPAARTPIDKIQAGLVEREEAAKS